MREIHLVIRSVLAATLLSGGRLEGQSDLPISDTTLANGLQVIVIENHSVPLVTIEIDVRNGAYTQTPEYEGLSHMYEHMFFKANQALPSQERYMERLRELGALWNGVTNEERVNHYITLGTDSLIPALQFMEDAIRYPLFDNEELVRERAVVMSEYDRNEAAPAFHLQRAIDTLLWSPAYYPRKNIGGNREVILTAPRERMQDIQRRFYVPNNSALILAGDITPQRGFELARQIFGDWPRGADPFATPIPNPPPLDHSLAVIVEKPVNGVSLQMAWQGPGVADDPASTYVADVVAQLLSNAGSPFHEKLVESGLTFGTRVVFSTLAHGAPIYALVQATPDKLLQAQRELLSELEKLADTTYVSQHELEAAQAQLGIEAIYQREQATAWAHTVGRWWAVASLDYYRGYVPNMQKVTQADIARFARRYLIAKPYVAGAMLSPAAVAQIGLKPEMLLQGG